MDISTIKDPCGEVDLLARSIPDGMWLNYVVKDPKRSEAFQTRVLGAETIFNDGAFAIMRFGASTWMMHADHTYGSHPMCHLLNATSRRGVGCEIRLQGCDPDLAEARARQFGYEVLQPVSDKPHGLREAFIVDPDGYVWAPCVVKCDEGQDVS